MPTLVAVGDSVDRIASWGAITTTTDGRLWTPKHNPFDRRGKCLGFAAGVINNQILYYVIGDGGLVGSSTDGINWTVDKIWFGNFQPLSIFYYDQAFYVCGQYKFAEDESVYKNNDEVGLVMKNTTGGHLDWDVIYTHRHPNSRFYNLRLVEIDSTVIYFAFGSDNNKPLLIYSLDYGFTWNSIRIPNNFDVKHVYDCCFTTTNDVITGWVATDRYILKVVFNGLTTDNWTASRSFQPKYGRTDFVKIATNGTAVVAVCSGGIAYTTDQSGWTFIEQPGYSFRSVVWFNNIWIASAESLLTQYTHWISTDTENWIPDNCGVQIFNSAII